MGPSELGEFSRSLTEWDRFFAEGRTVPLLEAEVQPRSLAERTRNLRRRLRDGPHAPVRIAFFGATGAGKSKLFNSLLNRSVSPSGFRRPFTRTACYYLHEDWRALEHSLAGEVVVHRDPEWRHCLLLDTPDFDSVEIANRSEADRVLAETDAFVFVADSLKYADASIWEYLRVIHTSGKEYQIVLNKVQSETVVESFLARFRGTLGRLDDAQGILPNVVVVPEFPIDDATLIRPDHESLTALRASLQRMSRADGMTSPARLFRLELQGLMDAAGRSMEQVRTRQAEVQALHQLLDRRLREAEERLEQRLTVSLDSGVRDEVYQRVLRRIETLDVLRFPRRILSFPVRAARQLLLGWWRTSPEDPEGVGNQASGGDDATSAESFQMLEAELLQFANQVRVDMLAHQGFERLLTRERYRELRIEHEELKRRFQEEDGRFRAWVAQHAQETASQITGENKAKFFLSQLLFNSVLITAQVHSGGFSLMDLGLDGVVSPFMAKGIGMLIGNEKVQQFEKDARGQHQQALVRILESAQKRFQDFTDEAVAGITSLADTLESVLRWSGSVESLANAFASRPGSPLAASEGAESPDGASP